MFLKCALLAFSLSSSALGAPTVFSTPATVQKPGLTVPDTAKAHRDAVKKIFVDSYQAYK
jgi:mannosyl-oligosaccharide alpha-1,2-mannosidase